MPIYEYQNTTNASCEYCRTGFERLEKLNTDRLTACPHCSAPCKQKISAPNLHAGNSDLKASNLEKKGFTQYRKVSKGVYEKTAGKGPRIISDKD